MAQDKTNTSLKDFLDEETPIVEPRQLPEAFEEVQSAGTQSMGTFLDAVGADLSAPPEEDESPVHDPLAQHAAAVSEPGDHRDFLASMGVPVTPAPVQRRAAGQVVADSARKAAGVVQKNWVPSIVMTILITVIFFYIIGIFRF